MLAMLEEAADAPRRGWDGIVVRDRWRGVTMAALVRRGFRRYLDHGRDESDEGGGDEVPIYEITEAGKQALDTIRATQEET